MKGTGFTGCGKTLLCNRYGLQPVRKWLQTGPALAAEGFISSPFPAFSAACLAMKGTGFSPYVDRTE